MNRFVVDASVAVKWLVLFSREPLAGEAQRYLDRRAVGEIALLVPDLFWLEVANVLWKAARRRMCQPTEAEAALETLKALDLPTLSSAALVTPALSIALQHDRSVYDSVYIALAVRMNAQFVTADEKLANALAGQFPMKWLGAI